MHKVHPYDVGSADPGPPMARASSQCKGQLQVQIDCLCGRPRQSQPAGATGVYTLCALSIYLTNPCLALPCAGTVA